MSQIATGINSMRAVDRLANIRFNWVVDCLPSLDQQELYNSWNRTVGYTNNLVAVGSVTPSNFKVGSVGIGILKCPDDNTATPGQGNLSYAVNGGFVLGIFLGEAGLVNSTGTFSVINTDWTNGSAFPDISVTQKLGVMFMGSDQGNLAWDIKTTPSAIFDGASTTLMLSENTLTGYSPAGPGYAGGLGSNWACPLPNFSMFTGSHHVCDAPGVVSTTASLTCSSNTGLSPVNTGTNITDGASWANANQNGNFENINYGTNLGANEGGFPYTNSGHPGGFNAAFCDGSVRFLSAQINGTVYSKIITSAGSKLPPVYKQLPVDSDSIN